MHKNNVPNANHKYLQNNHEYFQNEYKKEILSKDIFVYLYTHRIYRNKIKYLLKLLLENDSLIIETSKFTDKYVIMLKNIKIVVLTCSTLHIINDVIIFIPSRITDMKSYSIANCVGKIVCLTQNEMDIILAQKINYIRIPL